MAADGGHEGGEGLKQSLMSWLQSDGPKALDGEFRTASTKSAGLANNAQVFARGSTRSYTSKSLGTVDVETASSCGLPRHYGWHCPPQLVHGSPLLRGTSDEFREEIISLVQRFYFDPESQEEISRAKLDIRVSSLLPELFDQRLNTGATLVYSQERPAPQNYDGLFITYPSDAEKIEFIYNNLRITDATIPKEEEQGDHDMLGSGFFGSISGHGRAPVATLAAFGFEIAFGISQVPIFSVRVRDDISKGCYFIPRDAIQRLLRSPRYQGDLLFIRDRVHAYVNRLISSWCSQHVPRLKIRLFANSASNFKHKLVAESMVKFAASDTVLCCSGDAESGCCWCILTGEAAVTLGDEHLTFLSQASGHSAWASWWGFPEVFGACSRRPTTVTITKDAVLLEVSSTSLLRMKDHFPAEYALLEKVAEKHMRMIAPTALSWNTVNFFKGCSPGLMALVKGIAQVRIYQPGENIVVEREAGNAEMFVIARGTCSVYREAIPKPLTRLSAGCLFGEVAGLGISTTRTATITCDTICDIRVLGKDAFFKALAKFPEDEQHIQSVAQALIHNRGLVSDVLREVFADLSEVFTKNLADLMYEQLYFVGQNIITQDEDRRYMFALVSGEVEVLTGGVVVAVLKAPAVFGEGSLLMPDTKSSSTVRSSTVCDCLVLSASASLTARLTKKFPQDMRKLKVILNRRMSALKETEEQKGRALELNADEPQKVGSFLIGCDPTFLKALSQRVDRKAFHDGDCILEEGRSSNHVYVIARGNCIVRRGKEQVGCLGVGDIAGEMALFSFGHLAVASVIADGLVIACTLERTSLLQVLENFPTERLRIQDTMAARIKQMNDLKRMQKLQHVKASIKAFAWAQDQASKMKTKKIKANWSKLQLLVSSGPEALKAMGSSPVDDTPVSPVLAVDALRELPLVKRVRTRMKMKMPTIGIKEGRDWVRKRQEQVMTALRRREEQLRLPQFADVVPASPLRQESRKLKTKAHDLYSKPVWHEMFQGKE